MSLPWCRAHKQKIHTTHNTLNGFHTLPCAKYLVTQRCLQLVFHSTRSRSTTTAGLMLATGGSANMATSGGGTSTRTRTRTRTRTCTRTCTSVGFAVNQYATIGRVPIMRHRRACLPLLFLALLLLGFLLRFPRSLDAVRVANLFFASLGVSNSDSTTTVGLSWIYGAVCAGALALHAHHRRLETATVIALDTQNAT